MKARIYWVGDRKRSYWGGGVEERFPCVRIWEDGTKDKGALVRRIWWNLNEKGVQHWFEFSTEGGIPI